eukprot:Hpha_TRINITY_DN34074_c0_g1::TRINITY_DN34074_c0_g1_i1::g.30539::m.30539
MQVTFAAQKDGVREHLGEGVASGLEGGKGKAERLRSGRLLDLGRAWSPFEAVEVMLDLRVPVLPHGERLYSLILIPGEKLVIVYNITGEGLGGGRGGEDGVE